MMIVATVVPGVSNAHVVQESDVIHVDAKAPGSDLVMDAAKADCDEVMHSNMQQANSHDHKEVGSGCCVLDPACAVSCLSVPTLLSSWDIAFRKARGSVTNYAVTTFSRIGIIELRPPR